LGIAGAAAPIEAIMGAIIRKRLPGGELRRPCRRFNALLPDTVSRPRFDSTGYTTDLFAAACIHKYNRDCGERLPTKPEKRAIRRARYLITPANRLIRGCKPPDDRVIRMNEFFVKLDGCPTHVIFPGVTIRTAWLNAIMISVVDFEPHAVVQEHRHPHEQMGIVLDGRAVFTIADESRTLGPGDVYRIPGNVPHKVVALSEPVRAFDVFAPPREEYK
jgi:mannose-6-phosphate isomerase-like protein (cupin superfamily)